jgi:hypothetical protein
MWAIRMLSLIAPQQTGWKTISHSGHPVIPYQHSSPEYGKSLRLPGGGLIGAIALRFIVPAFAAFHDKLPLWYRQALFRDDGVYAKRFS